MKSVQSAILQNDKLAVPELRPVRDATTPLENSGELGDDRLLGERLPAQEHEETYSIPLGRIAPDETMSAGFTLTEDSNDQHNTIEFEKHETVDFDATITLPADESKTIELTAKTPVVRVEPAIDTQGTPSRDAEGPGSVDEMLDVPRVITEQPVDRISGVDQNIGLSHPAGPLAEIDGDRDKEDELLISARRRSAKSLRPEEVLESRVQSESAVVKESGTTGELKLLSGMSAKTTEVEEQKRTGKREVELEATVDGPETLTTSARLTLPRRR
ncbi:Hypothetical predicted protein, partial [Olea europaea subsp. europaea]